MKNNNHLGKQTSYSDPAAFKGRSRGVLGRVSTTKHCS